ncbi:MAG: heparinase II/III-family protein [Ignavibacteria bacterium]|nr:heparinase II/III-family protein [Ignavibacteria bacterium]
MKLSDFFSVFNFTNFQSQSFKREVESSYYSKKPISLPPVKKIQTDDLMQFKSNMLLLFPYIEGISEFEENENFNFKNVISKAEEMKSYFSNDKKNPVKFDWNLDRGSGHQFPQLFIWNKELMRFPKGVDPVTLWKFGSFNFSHSLAVAFVITGDENYVDLFLELIQDFQNENPFCATIQWYDESTTSIRLVNLCLALAFFSKSERMDHDKINSVIELILYHAVYLENFINSTKVKDYRYYLALLGLLSTSVILGESSYSNRIKSFVQQSFESGIKEIIHRDGIFTGQSITHHLLITECFLLAKVLLHKKNFEVSKYYDDQLYKMLLVVSQYLREDGSIPKFGDDIISTIIFDDKNYVNELLCCGAYLFKDRELKYYVKELSHELIFLFGVDSFKSWNLIPVSEPPIISKGFELGGQYILRKKDFNLFVRAGSIGDKSSGAPSHNDTFAFELNYKNKPFIVDAGTYSFFADKELRNQLRSVFNHNTFYVDNEQLAEFEGIYRIKNDLTKPKLLEWKTNNDEDILSVQHYAYVRLSDPVISKRTFHLFKEKNKLKIKDEFIGGEKHVISGNVNFHPDVKVTKLDTRQYLLENGEVKINLTFNYSSEYFESFIHTSNFSPEYGKLIVSKKIHYALSETLPAFYIIEMNLL